MFTIEEARHPDVCDDLPGMDSNHCNCGVITHGGLLSSIHFYGANYPNIRKDFPAIWISGFAYCQPVKQWSVSRAVDGVNRAMDDVHKAVDGTVGQ